ncbi:MAG: SEC-C domain-containing protein [Myxococcales bacterium]|nr:SEC-C domain-containing protein [Myxococcales bacterium]
MVDAVQAADETRSVKVPTSFVDGLLATLPRHWLGSRVGIGSMAVYAAWGAMLEPAALYLPAAYLSAMDASLDLDRVREALADAVRWEGRDLPITRDAPKVGRNDACPCGSGRKYKRCCLGK